MNSTTAPAPLHEQVTRADEARTLLEHPLLAQAFQSMKDEVIEQWQKAPAHDVAGREKLWLTLKLLDKLQGTLRQTVETGKVARKSLLQRAADEALLLARRTGARRSP